MTVEHLIEATDARITSIGSDRSPTQLGPPGLLGIRHVKPTRFEAIVYEPVVCLILQGVKETVVGDKRVALDSGNSLIVSHDLPVTARVTEASDARPYIALVFTLDLGLLRALYEEVDDLAANTEPARAFDAHATDPALIDAFQRYLDLAERPSEMPVLAPLIRKEIHFRLLIAPHGAMLRNLLWRDSHASRISRAIGALRRDFRAPLTVRELAEVAGMSASSFHEHFKAITSTTPLQYQKDLRLTEARRLLTEGGLTVSAAAFDVGYESATQFSREYGRKFGTSPRNDLAGLSIAV